MSTDPTQALESLRMTALTADALGEQRVVVQADQLAALVEMVDRLTAADPRASIVRYLLREAAKAQAAGDTDAYNTLAAVALCVDNRYDLEAP